jgi:chromosome segregation ATPase
MTNKTVSTSSIIIAICVITSAYSEDISHLKATLQQDQMQYQQDQQALKPIQEKINGINQQINDMQKPLNEKYKGLDDTLRNIDKPFQDQISKLNQAMWQADQPYHAQIKQRNEEQERINHETWRYRDQIRDLNESVRKQRHDASEDARKVQADRAMINMYMISEHANHKAEENQHAKPITKVLAQPGS